MPAPGCCDAQRAERTELITLFGLCLVVMTILHWFLEPLEGLVTPLLELRGLPWVFLLLGVWLFAAPAERGRNR